MVTDALPGLALEVVPPPAEQDVLRTDVAAVLGRTRRGPIGVPVRVESRLDFERWFGPVNGAASTPLAVRGFFENGGRTAWVLRVGRAGRTASTVWTPGDPAPAGLDHRDYQVLATSPGTWANNTRVRLRYQASSVAGPPTISVRVVPPGEPAETFPPTAPERLVDQLAASRFIRLVPLGDRMSPAGTGGPLVRQWDLELGRLAGAPAEDQDRCRGTDVPPGPADYRLAAETVAELQEPALVCAPDLADDLAGAGPAQAVLDLLTAVEPTQDRLVVLDMPAAPAPDTEVALRGTGPESSGPSVDAAIAWVQEVRAVGDERLLRCAAVYHPRLRVRAGPAGADDTVATVPAAGHVLGVIARLDGERGPHHTPANAVVLEAVDLELGLPMAQEVRLFEAGVNLLRSSTGRGVQVWGGRTLATTPGGRYVAHRRLVHLLVRAIRGVAGPLVFEVNGPQLRLTLVRGITSVLLAAFRSGALAGDRPEEAFRILCDEQNNPPGQAPEVVVCDVEVAPVVPMEFIRIRVVLGQDRGLEVLES
ncbi:phage tail sheath subtilisin-like domain-containing protein [Modestobacter excelsi]|uniref:phage tail sheath subtilisin-like domain-containing protein n=1 Tax=Modestobacter excelsi TaxID=2213161 RepID=UPI00110CBE50|nr:phage tail sheath subtilisin-like domain-containing protein [Modestobacter excelsi]